MDQFQQHTVTNRAGNIVPKFYQRSQSVVDRNSASDTGPPSHKSLHQPEWPGPPVPVRSERRGAFRRRPGNSLEMKGLV
ncbi:Uncharacterized protein APZ42_020958 [Daphnia magna]|uniref:Uncharacterized protein n=2 Tax=Daphnia magna TaxID=35525 RepID=A0A164X4N6_9CRUS|nr:hypothetical protein OUZ56_028307 [Daphnia magna]KZS13868.1 Uncharacterized protein APZ42_020958 [Daphnia magna]